MAGRREVLMSLDDAAFDALVQRYLPNGNRHEFFKGLAESRCCEDVSNIWSWIGALGECSRAGTLNPYAVRQFLQMAETVAARALVEEYFPDKLRGFLEHWAETGNEEAWKICDRIEAFRKRLQAGTIDLPTARKALSAIKGMAQEVEDAAEVPFPTTTPRIAGAVQPGRQPEQPAQQAARSKDPRNALVKKHLRLVESVGRECARKLHREEEEGKACARMLLHHILKREPDTDATLIAFLVKRDLMATDSPLRKAPQGVTGTDHPASPPGRVTAEQELSGAESSVAMYATTLGNRRDDQDARQERVRETTGILLGRHDPAAALPEYEVRQREDGTWIWPSRPGCDDRIVQAVAPFMRWRSLRPDVLDVEGLVEFGDLVDPPGTDWSTRGLYSRLHQVVNKSLKRRKGQGAVAGQPSAKPIPWHKTARGDRQRLLDDAAMAIEALVLDRRLRERLRDRFGAEFVELVRWARRLRDEAEVLPAERSSTHAATTEFNGMVRRLSDIHGRGDKALPPLMVGYIIFALDLDEGGLPHVLNAVRDAYKVIRSAKRHPPVPRT
jgi:hypothetical protein